MFVRDKVALNYLARAILLTFPFAMITWGTRGPVWETIMLLAVFLVGRQSGLFIAAVGLVIGNVLPLVVFGGTALNQLSLVPLAGLLGVLGWHRRWPVRVTLFWGAMFAAVLGALRTIPFMLQGFDTKTESDMAFQQYQATGILAVLKEQGISELEVREGLQQVLEFFALINPSFAAMVAFVEFGLVFYCVRRWLKDDEGRVPFAHWSLPWYAVWGAVLGITFYLVGNQFSWFVLRGVGINLMVVYGALTLVLGTSVYFYFLQSPRVPRFLKFVLIIASIIFFQFSVITIIMLGLFDLVLNFRSLPEDS